MRVGEINDQFGDLADDKPVRVDIGPEDNTKTLELDMRVDDLHPLMVMGESDEVGEEQAEKLTDVIRTVLYRSYLPHWDDARDEEPDNMTDAQQDENEEAKKTLENILLKYLPDIFVGISEDLGWQDEQDAHATLQQAKSDMGKSHRG